MNSRVRRLAGPLVATLAAACTVATIACSGKSSPSAPSTPSASLNLAGTWAGSASDSSGPGLMTWQLTQSGTAVTGSAVVADSLGVTVARGTLSGTLSGSSLPFTVTIPAGGFDSGPSCTGQFTGTVSATAASMSGSYSGTQSCSGAFSSGTLTLNKQ
jgi:hypothetical protein